MKIEEMKAGRELDKLIAEVIFNLPVQTDESEFNRGYITYAEPGNPAAGWWDLPHYSTKIEDAWQVVEALAKKYYVTVGVDANGLKNCKVVDGDTAQLLTEWICESAPEAICKAVLIAAARCTHQWIDARNDVILSGEICNLCGAMRGNRNPLPEAAGG